MSRRGKDDPYREPADSAADAVAGLIWGGLIGASIGLGVCVWVIPGPLLFPGDTMVVGAVACGAGGYFYGDRFLDWLRENAWWM